MPKQASAVLEETLDPKDWESTRKAGSPHSRRCAGLSEEPARSPRVAACLVGDKSALRGHSSSRASVTRGYLRGVMVADLVRKNVLSFPKRDLAHFVVSLITAVRLSS